METHGDSDLARISVLGFAEKRDNDRAERSRTFSAISESLRIAISLRSQVNFVPGCLRYL